MNVDFEKILLLCESDDGGWLSDIKRRLASVNRIRKTIRQYLRNHPEESPENIRAELLNQWEQEAEANNLNPNDNDSDDEAMERLIAREKFMASARRKIENYLKTHSSNERKNLLKKYDQEASMLIRQFLNAKKILPQLENLTAKEIAELASKTEEKIKQLYDEKKSNEKTGLIKHNEDIDTKIKNLTLFVRLIKDFMEKPETVEKSDTEKAVDREDKISPEDMKKMNPAYTNPPTDEQRDEERQKSIEKFKEQQRENDEAEAGKTNISHSFSDDLASVLRSYMIKRGANAAEQERALQPQHSTEEQPIRKWVDEDEGPGSKTTMKITRDPDGARRLHVVPGYRKGKWAQIKKESYSTNDLIWNAIVESTEYHRWKMIVDD